MEVKYRVTPVVKERKLTISVLVITESSKSRHLLGTAGGAWLEAEVQGCTAEEFSIFLPHGTESEVQNLAPGNYTFDSDKGKWQVVMSFSEFKDRLSENNKKPHFTGREVAQLLDGVAFEGKPFDAKFIEKTWRFYPLDSQSPVSHREIYDLLQSNGKLS